MGMAGGCYFIVILLDVVKGVLYPGSVVSGVLVGLHVNADAIDLVLEYCYVLWFCRFLVCVVVYLCGVLLCVLCLGFSCFAFGVWVFMDMLCGFCALRFAWIFLGFC